MSEETDKIEQAKGKLDEKKDTIESTVLIDKANAAAERMEKANVQLGRLLAKQERLNIENTLSGTAEAGIQEKTQEEKEEDEAKKLLEGTGYEDLFDKPKENDRNIQK